MDDADMAIKKYIYILITYFNQEMSIIEENGIIAENLR